MKTKESIRPFSNGSEAMDWVSNNCSQCVKAYYPKKEGEWPSFKTIKHYCSIGKECKLKYHIDLGFITGEIPLSIAQQIGMDEIGRLNQSCLFYSDNNDDGYKPKPRPKPDTTPDNQMVIPFIIEKTLEHSSQLV